MVLDQKSFKKCLKSFWHVVFEVIGVSLWHYFIFLLSCRKGKEVPPSFKHFFSSAMSLSSINVSGTKLPPEALKWENNSLTFILQSSSLCPTFSVTVHVVPNLLLLPISPFKTFKYSMNKYVLSAYITVWTCCCNSIYTNWDSIV